MFLNTSAWHLVGHHKLRANHDGDTPKSGFSVDAGPFLQGVYVGGERGKSRCWWIVTPSAQDTTRETTLLSHSESAWIGHKSDKEINSEFSTGRVESMTSSDWKSPARNLIDLLQTYSLAIIAH